MTEKPGCQQLGPLDLAFDNPVSLLSTYLPGSGAIQHSNAKWLIASTAYGGRLMYSSRPQQVPAAAHINTGLVPKVALYCSHMLCVLQAP